MKLKDKICVVTGGGQGIGKATAILFAKEGAHVAILERDAESGKRAATEISDFGNKANFYETDVTSLQAVESAAKQIQNDFGDVDVLVNNAGITADKSLKKMSESDFDSVIAVNLKGVFNCTKVFGIMMAEKGAGSIISASSVVAHYGNFGQTNYVATKAAVIGMTKTWARELAPKGVRVNAVAPGFIETDMIKSVPEDVLQSLSQQVPLKRLGKAEDVAAVYLFLASEDAAYVNGAVINVDGGLVL